MSIESDVKRKAELEVVPSNDEKMRQSEEHK